MFTKFCLKISLSSERKFHSFYLTRNRDALRTVLQGYVIFAVTIEFSIAMRRYSIMLIVCIFLFFPSILINDIKQNDVNYRKLILFLLFYFFFLVSTKIRLMVDCIRQPFQKSYCYNKYVLLNNFIMRFLFI